MHVVEGKSTSDLRCDEVVARHRDIRVYLKGRGICFHEVSEADNGTRALQSNLDRLRRAARIKSHSRTLDAARARIRSQAPATFGALQDLIGEPAAGHALAHGLLFFNVHQALDRSTVLVDQPNEAIDAALFLYPGPPASAL